MIICVTPNPAIDRTLTVPQLRLGEPQRATEVFVAAGGKGLNVARVVQALGGAVVCAGFVGGYSGQLVAALAEREGLPAMWTPIVGETRTCLIIIDPQAHDATVINEPGPTVAADDWTHLATQVVERAPAAAAICLSGSLPPGSSPADYALMLRQVRATGCALWVDTSGAALQTAIEVGGLGIKVNGAEAGESLGQAITQPGEALHAAHSLHRRTGAPVVLTLGSAGAVFVNEQGGWHAQPPEIQLVSSVGSGDAFLGGLVLALTHDAAPPTALCHAVAAGAANALEVGGGRLSHDHFHRLLASTTITAMRAD